MKAIEHKNFDPRYPEKFDWNNIDSISLSNIAKDIQSEIDFSFKNDDARIFVPGLRRALNIIAKKTDVDEYSGKWKLSYIV